MKTHLLFAASLLPFVGCAVDAGLSADVPLIDDSAGKSDDASGPRAMSCYATASGHALTRVVITPNGDTFDIAASSATGAVFSLTGQRPSLQVQIEDGDSVVPNEVLAFDPGGLDVVPVTSIPHFELSLATGPKLLTYTDATKHVELECTVSAPKLLAFVDISYARSVDLASAKAIGFDIDDTLLFSTPAFAHGFATGGTPAPTDVVFWTHTNGCDPGCPAETITAADGTTRQLPATAPSAVKSRATELVAYHQSLGQEVYAITGRPDINGEPLRAYLEAELGIPRDHVFFEPTNKTDRMKQLGLDVFYGDSDSDITDARSVQGHTVRALRFERSPKSSNRKEGHLAKYHPGYYGEPIVAGSYE